MTFDFGGYEVRKIAIVWCERLNKSFRGTVE